MHPGVLSSFFQQIEPVPPFKQFRQTILSSPSDYDRHFPGMLSLPTLSAILMVKSSGIYIFGLLL